MLSSLDKVITDIYIYIDSISWIDIFMLSLLDKVITGICRILTISLSSLDNIVPDYCCIKINIKPFNGNDRLLLYINYHLIRALPVYLVCHLLIPSSLYIVIT